MVWILLVGVVAGEPVPEPLRGDPDHQGMPVVGPHRPGSFPVQLIRVRAPRCSQSHRQGLGPLADLWCNLNLGYWYLRSKLAVSGPHRWWWWQIWASPCCWWVLDQVLQHNSILLFKSLKSNTLLDINLLQHFPDYLNVKLLFLQ